MSDTFRDLNPQELHHTLLQFMGENLGELKQLDSSLVAKNNTLQGMTLQPGAVLKSIPMTQQMRQPAPPPQPEQVQPQIQLQTPVVQQIKNEVIVEQVEIDDPNQLLFNFVTDLKNDPSILDTIKKISNNTDYRASDLCVSLKRIEDKIDKLINICSLPDKSSIKKKDSSQA